MSTVGTCGDYPYHGGWFGIYPTTWTTTTTPTYVYNTPPDYSEGAAKVFAAAHAAHLKVCDMGPAVSRERRDAVYAEANDRASEAVARYLRAMSGGR